MGDILQGTKENKLGTMPIGKLLVSVSVPIVISMLVQALYNVVDSIFVAQIGEEALAAVSLAFPIQNLMIAVGVGTSVGVNSLLSRRLGEKNHESANRAACNGLFLAVLSWLAFAVYGIFFASSFFAEYAKDPQAGSMIAQMGTDYLRIVTIASPGLFVGIMTERLLQSTGRSMLSMTSQLVGALTNIILDPIMIFGWFGVPAMGVAGAAYATVIGQMLGMVVGLFLNQTRNPEIKVRLRGFRPNFITIKHIYQVGLPSIIMQSIGSLMVFGMNEILYAFGTIPISVLGVYFKLQSFIFMPVFGFNNGMIPIIAYNFGARNRKRIEQTIRIGLQICFGIMVVGTILFWVLPKPMLLMFKANDEMLAIGIPALRIISLGFPMAAVGIVFSGVFQAMGRGMYSLLMSIVRQLVFLLPLAWLLAQRGGLYSIWFSFPIAEIFSIFLAIVFFKNIWQKQIRVLGQDNAA